MKILALDIATRTGWALGHVGENVPQCGSIRFAKAGASHAAIFAHALQWSNDWFGEWQPKRIVFEAPLPGSFARGKTNVSTAAILNGLPAIMQAVAHIRGIYDISQASAREVRMFFLGANPKRNAAKAATIERCKRLGWSVDDDNAADACALWLYACSFVDPLIGVRSSPLFAGQQVYRRAP